MEWASERAAIPLFVEGGGRDSCSSKPTRRAAQAIHAPTLQQSARRPKLDRLGEAREVAQIGAVLGRDFSYRLLKRRVVIRRGISTNCGCKPGWIGSGKPTSCSSTAPSGAAAYRFKHALIQDAAYDSLLKSRRQALHRRAAAGAAATRTPSPRRSPIISPRPVSTIPPSNGWEQGRATRRSAARPSRRRSPISAQAIAMADKAGRGRRSVRQAAWPLWKVSGCRNCTRPMATRSSRREADGAPETMEAFARARKSASGG